MSEPARGLRVFVVSTTTHYLDKSTSMAMLQACLSELVEAHPVVEIRLVNAADLHIVQNLSCYASGKMHCADPAAGSYRCWAHDLSLKDPAKFGGVDQMGEIYDGLEWADVVLMGTSVRWGSHSALMQTVIERMNTLENRATVYGEPYPMAGKRLGVVVAGLHWRAREVAQRLAEVFRYFGFTMPAGSRAALWWQRTLDKDFEHPEADLPYVEAWLSTPEGQAAVRSFVRDILS